MKQETTGKQFAESADKVITVTRNQTKEIDVKKLIVTFDCHNNVNRQTGKELFLEENLSEAYKKTSLSEPIKDIYEMFRIALERSQLKLEDVNRWKTSIVKLRMLYGV